MKLPSWCYPYVCGIATMAVLIAAVSYTNPPLRCVSAPGTVYVSEPVNRCYPITSFVPAGALEAAR